MPKRLVKYLSVLFLSGILIACSSPEEKAADYIKNAENLFEEGNLGKAEIEYKNALQINQNLPEAWFGIAKINEARQEWRKVYAVLNKIRELAPNHFEARIMLAQILLASNQIDHALADAKELLEMAPDDASAHSLMAAVQFRLENFDGAKDEVNKALAINPSNDEAILVRARVLIAEAKYTEAIGVLDKALKKNPDKVSMYLMKIQAYQEIEDKKEIEKVYLTLISKFPDNLAFKNALVRSYLADKDVNAAEKLLQQFVESNPSNVDERVRFVGFKNRYRSTDEAISLVKTYIDSNKDEYRYRFLLAELYEAEQQIDQALAVYQQIVVDDELQQNGLEARNKIAVIELRSGKRQNADSLINEVLAQDKNNENGLLLKAGLQIADQNFDDALVSARTVLRDNPDSIKALALLGQAYNAKGSSELAVESYTSAFKLSPSAPVIANQLARLLIRQGKLLQADEVIQESIEKGNRSVDAVKLWTQVKLSLGDWEKAEQLAKQLEKMEGQEAISQQVMGIVYQGKENQAASIDAFKRAHELAPAAAQPVVALVQAYVRNGKLDDARRFLNAIISVDSDNTTAYMLLGGLSLQEKKLLEAIAHYKKVIEINPQMEIAYRSLATLYVQEDELNKAEAIVLKGLSAMPERPSMVMNLASIYERQGNFRKAIEAYESLLAKEPGLVVAKNNLASLLTDHDGNPASLEKARTIAVDLRDSQIPQFRDTYAWALVKSGINIEEAVVILEGIVKDNDQVDVYSYHLGEAYRVKGETDNAIAYLKKATELARPGSDIADKAKQSLQQIKQ